MIVSVLLVIFPHVSGVNPSGMGVSVDERVYLRLLEELRADAVEGGGALVESAFRASGGDRPFSFLAIIGVGGLTGLPDDVVVKYLPVILAPAFVFTSYLLFRSGMMPFLLSISTGKGQSLQGQKQGEAGEKPPATFLSPASLVALLAAFSPQIVVGVYAGFLANLMALIRAFFALLLVLRLYNSLFTINLVSDRYSLLISGLLFVSLFVTNLFHVYTWGFMIISILLFTAVSYFILRRSRMIKHSILAGTTLLVIAVVVASIAADYAKSISFGVSSGLASDSVLASRSFGLENFASRWETLAYTVNIYLGGYLLNPVLLILALVWIARSNYRKNVDRLLLSMAFIFTVTFLFGTDVVQARVLYEIPMFIMATLGLYAMRSSNSRFFNVMIVAVILTVAVYALRAMANLYLIVPEHLELEESFLT